MSSDGTTVSTNSDRGPFGLLAILVCACLAVFAVQRWLVLPLGIPSVSMQPDLRRGDRILVRHNHSSTRDLARSLDRGDVLVFRAPETGDPLVVKRVIGLPGEEIQASDGIIAVNGDQVLVEQWLPDSERQLGSDAAGTVDIPRTRLDDDEVFVLGDNRDDSVDSRSFGPVPLDRVVGTVAYRFWPLSRAGQVSWT